MTFATLSGGRHPAPGGPCPPSYRTKVAGGGFGKTTLDVRLFLLQLRVHYARKAARRFYLHFSAGLPPQAIQGDRSSRMAVGPVVVTWGAAMIRRVDLTGDYRTTIYHAARQGRPADLGR